MMARGRLLSIFGIQIGHLLVTNRLHDHGAVRHLSPRLRQNLVFLAI